MRNELLAQVAKRAERAQLLVHNIITNTVYISTCTKYIVATLYKYSNPQSGSEHVVSA